MTKASSTATIFSCCERRSFDNLADNAKMQTYPSGRAANYGYTAAGRLSSFSSALGDGVSRTYADQMAYCNVNKHVKVTRWQA